MTGGELTDDELSRLYRTDPHAAANYLVAKLCRERDAARAEVARLLRRIEQTTCNSCLRMRGDAGGEG